MAWVLNTIIHPLGAARALLTRAKELVYFGFLPPSTDGMQTPERMRFLHDCIMRYAPHTGGVALASSVTNVIDGDITTP